MHNLPREGNTTPASVKRKRARRGDPPLDIALTSASVDDPAARSIALGTPTNVRYAVLAWACSLSMMTYIDRVCIKSVGSDMQTDLGISKGDFGWVFSAFGFAYALFEVPSGWLGIATARDWLLTRIVLWWSLFTR